MHVDADAFYVSVEQRRDPSLRGRPVVVGGGAGDRGVVLSASYEARAFGVRAAMPLRRAAALCPDATFLPPDPEAYAAASRELMAALSAHAPRVQPLSPDEALLDVTGCERRHPSWIDAAEALHRDVLERTGLSVSVGVGGTRSVARIAAALAKPAGVLEVPRGEEAAFLAGLPVEHLGGVGPRTRDALARLGVHAVGDLVRLPEGTLEAALGRTGEALLRQARGLDDRIVLDGRARPRSISRDTTFARDTSDRAEIAATLSFLAQRATEALRREGCLAGSVGVRLRDAGFRTTEVRRRLPAPTDSDREVLGLVEVLWPLRYRGGPLRLVGVVLHDLGPSGERQLGLFGGTGEDRRSRAVDAVRSRHGFHALLRGEATRSPRRSA
jgi:DNA polymerase-4